MGDPKVDLRELEGTVPDSDTKRKETIGDESEEAGEEDVVVIIVTHVKRDDNNHHDRVKLL